MHCLLSVNCLLSGVALALLLQLFEVLVHLPAEDEAQLNVVG